MKLVITLFLLLLFSVVLFLFITNNKTVNLDEFEVTTGTIISANIYQERIKTELRSLNSGIPQASFKNKWKITITYKYKVKDLIHISSDSYFLKYDSNEELLNKLKNYTATKDIKVYYNKISPNVSLIRL